MKSLRVRIFVYIASVVLVFAVTVMLLNWGFLTSFYFRQGNSMLKSSASFIKDNMPEKMSHDTEAFTSVEEGSSIEIIIYTSEGEAVYATALRDFEAGETNPNWLRYKLEEIMGTSIVQQEYDSSSSRYEVQKSKDGRTTYLAYRAHIEGEYWAVVRMSADVLRNSASIANTFMMTTVILMLFVTVVVSIVIASHLSRPIRQMNAITRAMSRFDFSHKVKVSGKDEIAQLADSINILSDNTSALLDELKEKNARLEKEVENERALEKMRKEFVSNVSHELKTPIAIIQGYAEGLKLNVASDPERRAMYCDIIESESYKMDRLVKQLLELSRLESGSAPLKNDEFSLTEMATETISRIASITDDVTVSTLFDSSPRTVLADEMRIGQVLTNYLNNAIEHCKNEMQVTVNITENGDRYRVSVFNTGDGIPKESMERLWDSFYRADKSRSRENGNCGLGLSIVSTIMKQMGEQYGVENVENGVVFWFEVKKQDNI